MRATAMGRWTSFLAGLRNGPSTGAIVLICSFIGFGALTSESGLNVWQALSVTLFVWALPGQVVLVSEIANGAAVWTAGLSVTLTAVRLMPLIVTLMPIMRSGRTSKLVQLIAAHLVAITVWVESMLRLPKLAREDRLPFFFGMASFLVTANLVATAIGHTLSASFGALTGAILLFLTPIYFTLSMLRASDALSDRLALLFGLALGPVIFITLPGFELVLSGLIGGTIAYLIDRHARRGRVKA